MVKYYHNGQNRIWLLFCNVACRSWTSCASGNVTACRIFGDGARWCAGHRTAGATRRSGDRSPGISPPDQGLTSETARLGWTRLGASKYGWVRKPRAAVATRSIQERCARRCAGGGCGCMCFGAGVFWWRALGRNERELEPVCVQRKEKGGMPSRVLPVGGTRVSALTSLSGTEPELSAVVV